MMGGRKAGTGRKASYRLDSESEDETEVVSELYSAGGLAAALQRGEDYAAAVQELTHILTSGLYSGYFSKTAQAAVLQDVAAAIACCSGRMHDRRALAALMEAVERHLPQAKRNALLRDYKRSSVALRRRERKGGASAPAYDSDSDSGEELASFTHLPSEVASAVLQYLDPLSLARAACVCAEWRQLASEDPLWRPLFEQTFPVAHQRARLLRRAEAVTAPAAAAAQRSGDGAAGAAALGQQEGEGKAAGCQGGLFKAAFSLGAQRRPQALLRWRTNRVLRGGRLCWLTAVERQALLHSREGPSGGGGGGGSSGGSGGSGVGAEGAPPGAVQGNVRRYRHLSPQEVVAFYRAGGRLPAAGAEESSSGSQSESEDEAVASMRLKFWRLGD